MGRKYPQMRCSCITWKSFWTPQWIRLVGTQAGTLWIGSSKLLHQQCLATRYIFWMGQGLCLQFKGHMSTFSTVILGYGWVEKFQMDAADQ